MLALGYVVALVAASLACAATQMAISWVAGFDRGTPLAERLQYAVLFAFFAAFVYLTKSLFVAWAPFACVLVLAGTKMSRRFACIIASFAAAMVMSGWMWWWPYELGDRVPDDAGFVIEPVPLWWSLIESSPYALVSGVAGGLLFWRICFYRRRPA